METSTAVWNTVLGSPKPTAFNLAAFHAVIASRLLYASLETVTRANIMELYKALPNSNNYPVVRDAIACGAGDSRSIATATARALKKKGAFSSEEDAA